MLGIRQGSINIDEIRREPSWYTKLLDHIVRRMSEGFFFVESQKIESKHSKRVKQTKLWSAATNGETVFMVI